MGDTQTRRVQDVTMQRVRYETVDHTAYITLNRPEARNAFDPQMILELTELFRNFSRENNLRCVVLEGEGKTFCSGADLQWMQSMANFSLEENRKDAQALDEMFATMRACNLPIVGRVQGHVMGGALGLIAVCDIVSAEAETQFCFSEVKLGLLPAVISPYVLEKTNRGHAQRFMITGEVFTAAQAGAMGLVHHVGTESESKAFVVKMIAALHFNGPESMQKTKELLRDVGLKGVSAEASALTTEAIAQRRVSDEGQEGLKAYFAKKDATWKIKL